MVVINKRNLLGGLVATAGAGMLGAFGLRGRESEAAARFEVSRTPEQWRQILSPAQYRVLREAGTERSGSSPLDREKRPGTFVCAGCGLPVFRSQDKFDSGTGWPSFVRPIPRNIGTRPDNSLFATRTEVHCRRCGGHLGHVFDDGPPPTGKRYCMNGVAMRFVAA